MSVSHDIHNKDTVDLAIIGAGPAGMTAALYASRAGLSVLMFERIMPGGQLAQTEHLENYPGYAQSTSGFELAMAMHAQAETFGAKLVSEEVLGLDLEGDIKTLSTSSGDYHARSLIVATGARPRHLGLQGEDELQGRGLSYCATCDGNFFRGVNVAVVGGGNTAAADALYLSRICNKVYLIHRRDTLRATAIYHQRLRGIDNIEFVWDSEVQELLSENGMLNGVRVFNKKDGSSSALDVDALFVAVGTTPNTEFLNGSLELDAQGYIVADELGRTATAGVFAAGDVRTKALRQVVTAVSDGAVCAEEAAAYLSLNH